MTTLEVIAKLATLPNTDISKIEYNEGVINVYTKTSSFLLYWFSMEKIKIGDKTYKLNIEKAKELGLLEEESTFKISTDYKTGAIVISEWYGKF